MENIFREEIKSQIIKIIRKRYAEKWNKEEEMEKEKGKYYGAKGAVPDSWVWDKIANDIINLSIKN